MNRLLLPLGYHIIPASLNEYADGNNDAPYLVLKELGLLRNVFHQHDSSLFKCGSEVPILECPIYQHRLITYTVTFLDTRKNASDPMDPCRESQ